MHGNAVHRRGIKRDAYVRERSSIILRGIGFWSCGFCLRRVSNRRPGSPHLGPRRRRWRGFRLIFVLRFRKGNRNDFAQALLRNEGNSKPQNDVKAERHYVDLGATFTPASHVSLLPKPRVKARASRVALELWSVVLDMSVSP
jgi:hypothetical protein